MLIFDQLKENDAQLRCLTLGVLGGMGLLLAGLWWVQIVSARNYQEHLETQSYRTVRIPAIRGKILDRGGNVLAENQPSYNISLYLEELRDQFQKEYARLRPFRLTTNTPAFWRRWLGVGSMLVKTQYVGMSKSQVAALTWEARYAVANGLVEDISRRLQQPVAFGFDQFTNHYARRLAIPCPVAKNISAAQLARFEEQILNPAAVDLEIQSYRYYPRQTTAAHVLGHLRYDDRSIEGEDAFFYYRLPDYSGVLGVEAGYEKELHGHAGVKSVLVNNLGYRQAENIWSPAESGRNVVLTIDLHVQEAAERALQNARVVGQPRGAAVVMDVRSGDILALASAPTFNPNSFIPRLTSEESQRLSDPKLRPEFNRATQENYAPGSIFKTLVGLACLEAGLDEKATIYNPGVIHVGRPIHDLAPPGIYNFRLAIMHSSNTYFITNGMKAGIENILKLARRLHLGEKMGLPTRQETPGVLPGYKQIHYGWSPGQTANICIGQGYLAVTPLQMAVMTCALANGGKVLWPRLVDRVESQDPAADEPPVVFPKGRIRDDLGVKKRNLEILQHAMLDEVEDAGTGWRAVVPDLRICGKTGTAQIMNSQNQVTDLTTWFISFAPFEQPRYAVVVMVESGVSGGVTCAPIAAKIYEAILESEQGKTPRTVAKAQ
jgi:penicillin-binding protein 2